MRKAFMIAAAAVASLAAHDRLPRAASYWQAEGRDLTVKVEPCIERGLCVYVYALNPKDPAVQSLATRFGRKSPREFCGYPLATALIENEAGDWRGTVTSPFGETVGLRVRLNENRLEARGFKLTTLLGKSFYFRPVTRPSKNFCTKI